MKTRCDRRTTCSNDEGVDEYTLLKTASPIGICDTVDTLREPGYTALHTSPHALLDYPSGKHKQPRCVARVFSLIM